MLLCNMHFILLVLIIDKEMSGLQHILLLHDEKGLHKFFQGEAENVSMDSCEAIDFTRKKTDPRRMTYQYHPNRPDFHRSEFTRRS